MEFFIDQLINGITLGSLYGLVAIGYTMVYGIIGMINFAHGDVFMVSTYIVLITIVALFTLGITSVPLILLLTLLIAMLLTAVYGWSVERVAYRPLRGSFRLAPLITAIGMSIVLQNYIQLSQGAKTKSLPNIFNLFSKDSTAEQPWMVSESGYEVYITDIQIYIILVTVALMVIFSLLISKTSLGRAQRACEQDMKMAALLGINVNRTISITFIMGAALAAVAGIMYLLKVGVTDFYIGFLFGVKAFAAAVLGGIGSLPGAMLGGLIIGIIEVFWSGYLNGAYKDVAAFSILAIVLIFLPSGLLGKPEVEKV